MVRIIINEQQAAMLMETLRKGIVNESAEDKKGKPYTVSPEKVLIVKRFLDGTFSHHDYEKIGPDGLPVVIKVISMNAKNGEPLKYMYENDLMDLLIDRFQNMFTDRTEREGFLRQVMKDWFAGKITPYGGLSVNRIVCEGMTRKEIDTAASQANTSPTEAQKEAGNYKMGHIRVSGMPISIENPKGSRRVYRNEDGTTGYNIMKHHYGYFNLTDKLGRDGDAIDVFVGPYAENCDRVYVVDQNAKDGSFDESKVMLGFKSMKSAKEAYLSNYGKDWKGFRAITGVPMDVFKKWLYRKQRQRKPFSDYVRIKAQKLKKNE